MVARRRKDGRQAEQLEQLGLVEGDDTRDAGDVDGEHLHRVGAVAAVAVAPVGGETGLAVGGDPDHREIARPAEDPGGEERRDLVPSGEPGRRWRHLKHRILPQQPGEGGPVGVLKGRRVLIEQPAPPWVGWLADLVGNR